MPSCGHQNTRPGSTDLLGFLKNHALCHSLTLSNLMISVIHHGKPSNIITVPQFQLLIAR